MLRAVVGTHSPFCWGAARKSVSGGAADQISPLDQGSHQVSKCPWVCKNYERAFTEGNRVLPAPRFPSRRAIACGDIQAGENGRSICSSRSSVLTRPRPGSELEIAVQQSLQRAVRDHLIVWSHH